MNAPPTDKKVETARQLLGGLNFHAALPAYEKLIRQYPNKPWVWMEYAVAAGGVGQMDAAERAFQKAEQLEPKNCENLLHIGHQCQNLRRPEWARAWFEKAVAANPTSINPRMALAIFHEQHHRFAEAREAIASCFAIDPNDDQARYFEALLDRRENKIESAERRLRALIASSPQHQYVQYASRYELAEVLNRTERYGEAMEQLLEAKKIVSRLADVDSMLKDYDREAGMYRRTTQALPKDTLRTWAKEFPEKSREAIPKLAFLGGHPRSGTTLLEQIVGAHPAVAAFDELTAFTYVVGRMFNQSQILSPARLNIIRRQYVEAMKLEWGGSLEGKMILDKNPSPTAKLRIWLRVFPEIRVLIALRDPRDVVVSCFFQNIALNPIVANFLTFERTVKHYTDLMDVWLAVRQWEGLAGMETRYEDIVADLEKEGRRVTEFLGLGWDDAQTRFHEKSTSKKKLYSPTYHDASQPVYTRAVARWRAYEKHLAPILPLLEPYCRALGYA